MSDAVNLTATRPIVVGVDGSPASEAALRWALGQAALTGARVEAVMTWFVPDMAYSYGATIDFREDARTVVQRTVDAVADQATNIDRVVLAGRPGPTLVSRAADADLLVIGSRGHGRVAGMLLGSVSEYCATHAQCPVVVIHADAVGGDGHGRGPLEDVTS